MIIRLFWGLLCLMAIALSSCKVEGFKNVAFLAGREVPAQERKPHWAQPQPLPGVLNLCRVDDTFYRGDEPTRTGLKQLQQMGIKTVVTVRALHPIDGRMKGLGMKYEVIPMYAWKPSDEHVAQFLRIMADPDNHPVFLHCYTGGDRAGLLAAAYRVTYCGWSKEEARAEMIYGGYGFHEVLIKYLVGYFDAMDVERVKQMAGLTDVSNESGQQQPTTLK